MTFLDRRGIRLRSVQCLVDELLGLGSRDLVSNIIPFDLAELQVFSGRLPGNPDGSGWEGSCLDVQGRTSWSLLIRPKLEGLRWLWSSQVIRSDNSCSVRSDRSEPFECYKVVCSRNGRVDDASRTPFRFTRITRLILNQVVYYGRVSWVGRGPGNGSRSCIKRSYLDFLWSIWCLCLHRNESWNKEKKSRVRDQFAWQDTLMVGSLMVGSKHDTDEEGIMSKKNILRTQTLHDQLNVGLIFSECICSPTWKESGISTVSVSNHKFRRSSDPVRCLTQLVFGSNRFFLSIKGYFISEPSDC